MKNSKEGICTQLLELKKLTDFSNKSTSYEGAMFKIYENWCCRGDVAQLATLVESDQFSLTYEKRVMVWNYDFPHTLVSNYENCCCRESAGTNWWRHS